MISPPYTKVMWSMRISKSDEKIVKKYSKNRVICKLFKSGYIMWLINFLIEKNVKNSKKASTFYNHYEK